MTLASDLAHEVCPESAPSGFAHDPSLPLVLGSTASSQYVVMTYDASANRWLAQVNGPGGANAIYGFDPTGQIFINNVLLQNTTPITALIQQAKDAAAASAASASSSATSADVANTKATAASSSAIQSANSATLAGQLASAPAGTPLPGGGNSCQVSVDTCNNIAQVSRDLVTGGTVTADETYQAGYCDTERQVTATGLVTITIPPSIFASASGLQRWGSYRLCNGTGSIKVVAQAGTPNLQTPSLQADTPRTLYRHASSQSTGPIHVQAAINVPALATGRLYCIALHLCRDNTTTISAPITSDASLTWTTVVAFPAKASGSGNVIFAVYAADLTSWGGGAITASIDFNTNNHALGMQLFAIKDPGPAAQAVCTPGNAQAVSFTASLASVPALSLLVAWNMQMETSANSNFTNWSANINNIASGDTNGLDDVTAGNGDKSKNFQWAFGSGVQNVAGVCDVIGNYKAATGKGGAVLIAIEPKSVIGGGGVVIEAEGDQDTMTTKFGIVELWFQNDGKTVRVRGTRP